MDVERRIDCGHPYTRKELQSYYKSEYGPAEIDAYWKELPYSPAKPSRGAQRREVNTGPQVRGKLFDVEGTPCIWLDTQPELDAAVAELALLISFAVDVEGNNLGHNGRAATIQLATREACYIVDLAKLGVPQSLRELLQGGQPLKFCHGFSGDQINLIEEYGLDFGGAALFDTQVAVEAIPSYEGRKSVVDILENFAKDVPDGVLDEMRSMKKQLQFVDFFRRPLPLHVARYSCLDVIFLSDAAEAMQELLPQDSLEALMVGSIYCGPWAKGACYRPPTLRAQEEKAKKGLVWSEQQRDFVKEG